MPAHVIAEIDVTDPAAYEKYRAKVPAMIAKYGPRRLAVLEFPSMAQALKWYRSAEYAPLIKIRQRASKGKLVAVEGL